MNGKRYPGYLIGHKPEQEDEFDEQIRRLRELATKGLNAPATDADEDSSEES